MTPRAILELGCRGEEKHVSDLTGGGQPRGGSEGGWHSLTLGSRATARGLGGTFCCTSLPSLGFLFYFPGGERGGGTPSQHGLPMSSVPLFPLPPPFISVGIGSFFLCPELCPPQTQTRLQVRPKAAALRRGGFGDADVQQKVEKLREG